VCRGDVAEDYEEEEIENFMEELSETGLSDSRWSTPLGLQVHALIRQKAAQ
jgi:hypothetical protein